MAALFGSWSLLSTEESSGDGLAEGFCDGWRERVANLPISGGLATSELPCIWKALETSNHLSSQLGHCRSREVRAGDLVGDAQTVNA